MENNLENTQITFTSLFDDKIGVIKDMHKFCMEHFYFDSINVLSQPYLHYGYLFAIG
jgi:hypothetical protein